MKWKIASHLLKFGDFLLVVYVEKSLGNFSFINDITRRSEGGMKDCLFFLYETSCPSLYCHSN